MNIFENGQNFNVSQGIGDLKAGYRYDDFSRMSAYGGPDMGLHTGANSPTLGRHGQPFGPINPMPNPMSPLGPMG